MTEPALTLRTALERCRDQFKRYAEEHRAKAVNLATPTELASAAAIKAIVNERMADMATAALDADAS